MDIMCEVLADELNKTNDKLEKSGGQISAGDLEYVNKLTHSIKSIKTTMAMMESDSDHSYARGRGSYARGRNVRGRYSREQGYSMANDNMVMELRELMQDAPDERTRMEFQKFIHKIEQM